MGTRNKGNRPLLGIIVELFKAPISCFSKQPEILSYLSLSTEYSIEAGKIKTYVRCEKEKQPWEIKDIDMPARGDNISELFRDDIRIICAVNNQSPNWCSGNKKIPSYFYGKYTKDGIESMHQYFSKTKNCINDITKLNSSIFSELGSFYLISPEDKSLLERYINDKPYYFLAFAWHLSVLTYKEFNEHGGEKQQLTPFLNEDNTSKEIAKNIDVSIPNETEKNINVTASKGRKQLDDWLMSDIERFFKELSLIIPDVNRLYQNFILLWGEYNDLELVSNKLSSQTAEASELRKVIIKRLSDFISCLPDGFFADKLNSLSNHTNVIIMLATDLDKALDFVASIIPDTLPLRADFIVISKEYNELKSKPMISLNYFKELSKLRQDLLNFISLIPRQCFGLVLEDERKIGESVVFYSQDESPQEFSFDNLTKNATKLYISARTGVGLLTTYENQFEVLAKSGCDMKLLFIKSESKLPSSESTDYTRYNRNSEKAKDCLFRMKNLNCKNLLIHSTKEELTFSVIYVERDKQEYIAVQMYFIESRIRRNRPLFVLEHEHKWFEAFKSEFEMLWKNSEEMEI